MADLSQIPTDQLLKMLQQQHAAAAQKPAQTSQTLGYEQGIGHFLSNMASAGDYAGRKVGLPMDSIESTLFGGKTLQQAKDIVSNPSHPKNVQPGNVGRFIADVQETAPLALVGGPVAGGAATGAVLSNEKTPLGVAKDAGIGAFTSKLGDAAIKGVGRVIAPTVSPYVKKLLDAGVRLTPGQIAGGAAQTIEDKATSIPGIGDMIRNARVRGIQDFNTAAINRALAPIGKAVPAGVTGRDAIDHASEALGQAYTDMLPGLRVNADPQLQRGVGNLTSLAKNIPQYGAKPITNFIKQEITPRFSKAGVMTGQSFKEVDSLIRQEAQNYSASGSPNDRKLGQAFWQLRNEFKDALERSNPGAKSKLQAIDSGYANLVRVQNAAARPGAEPGVFTPSQLSQAVKTTDRSVRKSAVARGNALMQDLSDAGKAVLPSTVPDSGTAGRMLAAALAGGGAAHFVAPAAAAPIAAGMGLYTKAGVKAAEIALTRRPAGANYAAQLVKKAATPTRIAAPILTTSIVSGD